MAFNPRHVPWMTICGVVGLVAGYLIGHAFYPDPMIPAFWGLCVGTGLALVLRFVLTLRWARRRDGGESDPPPPAA